MSIPEAISLSVGPEVVCGICQLMGCHGRMASNERPFLNDILYLTHTLDNKALWRRKMDRRVSNTVVGDLGGEGKRGFWQLIFEFT